MCGFVGHQLIDADDGNPHGSMGEGATGRSRVDDVNGPRKLLGSVMFLLFFFILSACSNLFFVCF